MVGEVEGVRVQALVHTHGTRLVRLAHVLATNAPEIAAADALATTLLRGRHDDAHEELMTAARAVGARAEPPIHDDARLESWLDRAELDDRQVDLLALQAATVQRIAVQRARRRAYRRRTGVVSIAAVALVGGASAFAGTEDGSVPSSSSPSATASSGTRDAEDFIEASPVDLSGRLPSPPALVPRDQRSADGITVGDVTLTGRASPIAHVHIETAPATVLAVRCVPSGQPRGLCVLVLHGDQALHDIDASSMLAVLPIPRGDEYTNRGLPSLGRTSVVDEFHLKTVLMEATSTEVGTVHVRFTNGQFAFATRFSKPAWDAALFVAVTVDEIPAALTYTTDGFILDRRVLYTATP